MTGRIRTALASRVLLVVPQVMLEATNVHENVDLDGKTVNLDEFEALLMTRLFSRFGPFKMARPSQETRDEAYRTLNEKNYPNKDGETLSYIDCLLLRLAVEHPNIDIMTEDVALTRAICAECGFLGHHRTPHSIVDHYKRRFNVAKTIQNLARSTSRVHILNMLAGTRYTVGGAWHVYVSDQSSSPRASIKKIEDTREPNPFAHVPHAMDLVLASWEFERGDYCHCDHSKGIMVKCACGDARYDKDLDSGLDEHKARKFLYSLPPERRNEIVWLTRSFEGFHYNLRGPNRQMAWYGDRSR